MQVLHVSQHQQYIFVKTVALHFGSVYVIVKVEDVGAFHVCRPSKVSIHRTSEHIYSDAAKPVRHAAEPL